MVPRENKTMLMQNFGGQTKSIMVFLKVAYEEKKSGINSEKNTKGDNSSASL